MIHSFSCKNFYSFKEEAIVSFVVSKQAPENQGYFTTPSGTRLSKVGVVIGPNASGKTNILKVIPFLRWLMISSFGKRPEDLMPIKPFQFSGFHSKPSELSVVYEISGQIYNYHTSLTQERILEEQLFIQSKSKTRITQKSLFMRIWNDSLKKYDLKFDNKKFNPPAGINNTLRENASLISTAIQLNHQFSKKVTEYWKEIASYNVGEVGYSSNFFMGSALSHFNDNPDLKVKMELILSKYDLGFSKILISKEKTEQGYRLDATVTHSIGDHEEDLNLKYESSGTKRLIAILYNILKSLKNGSPAVIDEIDINLHPDMVSELVGLYLHPETNPRNAQLLTSTHSHIILNKLDKYQIVLTEKNDHGSTEAWRLDEVGGVRSDDNYYTKYMAGSYGAIPNFDI